jgi:hypothetical protein
MTTLQTANPCSDNAVHRIVEMAAGIVLSSHGKMMQAKWLIFQLDESMDT